jgi:hypothetical protein
MNTVFKKKTERARRRSFHGMNSAMREPDMSLEIGGGNDFGDHPQAEKISSRYTMPRFIFEQPKAKAKAKAIPKVSPVANIPQRAREDESPKLKSMDQYIGKPMASSSRSPLGEDDGAELDFTIVDDFLEDEGINRSRRLNASSYGRRTRERGSGLESLLGRGKNEAAAAAAAPVDTRSSYDESIGSASAFGTTNSSPSSAFGLEGGDTPPRRLHRNTFEVGFLEGLRSSLLEMDVDVDLEEFDDDTGMPIGGGPSSGEEEGSRRGGMEIPSRRNWTSMRQAKLGLETIVGSPHSFSPMSSGSPPG